MALPIANIHKSEKQIVNYSAFLLILLLTANLIFFSGKIRHPKEIKIEKAVSTYWFVDNSASLTGANDGTSWNNAWRSFSAINWSAVNPGDTIYISGGINGKTYPGGIVISDNGTSQSYITIDSGNNSPFPSGHSGKVTIEGGNYCIRASGSYLKIKNLTCQHATSSGLRIEGVGTTLENNTIRETFGQGIHVTGCTGCIVRGNRITTFPNDGPTENRPYQTDGIVAYSSSDTLIESNWIKLTNQSNCTACHIDGIQASTNLGLANQNITIRYNYVENTKASTNNSQGIYLTQMQGNVKITGNVVYLPFGGQAVTSYLPNNLPVNVYIVGNTVKNGGYWVLHIGDDNPVIKNNILWQTCGSSAYIANGSLVKLESGWSGDGTNINNNLYYRPCSSGNDFYAPNASSWSAWQSKGFDTRGIFGNNPNLDNCYRPASGSQLIDKGGVLGNEYINALSMTLCGPDGPDSYLPTILSNRESLWDIGAYEFANPAATVTALPSGRITSTPAPTSPPVAISGDVNRDGKVDILDFQLLSNSFGKSSGQSGFNSNADINKDNSVNILDFQLLSNNFGK